MAAEQLALVAGLKQDSFTVTGGHCVVWKTKNIATIRHLSSTDFITSYVKFNFTWERNRYEDTSKECYEIFLKCEDATSRRSLKSIAVTTYLKDQCGNRSSMQTVSRKIPENVMHFRIWHAEVETLSRELSGLTKADHIVEVHSRIETQVGPRLDVRDKLIIKRYADPLIFLNILSEDSLKLLKEEIMTDVTLKCGEHSVKAHKAILSMRSKKFADLVLNNEETFNIDDMDYSTLQLVLRYIYSGKVPEVSNEQLIALRKAACQYKIAGLVEGCASFLILNLKPEDLEKQLKLADKSSDDWFKSRGSTYLKEIGYLRGRERALTRQSRKATEEVIKT